LFWTEGVVQIRNSKAFSQSQIESLKSEITALEITALSFTATTIVLSFSTLNIEQATDQKRRTQETLHQAFKSTILLSLFPFNSKF
jgi:hypothetical protein